MTEPSKAKTPPLKTKERIIVALDVEHGDEARTIVREIGDNAGAFKIGLQLFTAAGPDLVREMVASGIKVFLDLKFHDIPNTVARASVEAAKLGVWMFNMHASGGREMMRAAVEAVKEHCERTGGGLPVMIGVTALTSSDAATLRESGVGLSLDDHVIKLARDAADSGLLGVVSSPQEVRMIKDAIDLPNFCLVTPGIRAADATKDDQKRVMTASEAIVAGSDYLVIGRPITAAPDRKSAIDKIIQEIDQIR
ncbi:MAG: orotidine-5'-phosphate decarboxylase [Pyrinomonadaceae bacterium]